MTAEPAPDGPPPGETYQVMPNLTDTEFEGLKESIKNHGLLVPIEYDEHGAVLDGHHRLRALRELGREKQHSRVIRSGLDEPDKIAHALALNVHRRHLTTDQRAEAVLKLRQAGWSVRRIATQTGIPKSTVARDLNTAPPGDPTNPATVIGTDGKTYPARQPTKPTTVYVHSSHQQEVAQTALQTLAGELPTKPVELRRLERLRRIKVAQQRRDALRDQPGTVAGPDLRCADINDLHIEPGSVDLLLTDPPFLQTHFEPGGPWDTLGNRATTWLKPGGLLLAYCSHIHLAKAITLLGNYENHDLHYWWTYAVVFKGGSGRQVRTRAIASSWRPVLAYRKAGGPTVPRFSGDPVLGEGREKTSGHEWQQGLHEARVFVDRLCPPGPDSLVLDPFVGSGTVAVAAALEGRRVIAADIEPDYVRLAGRRIADALTEQASQRQSDQAT